MEFIVAAVIISTLAYISRWNAGLNRAFYVVGCKTGGVGGWVGGSGFQDAIIPTWWAPFSIAVWLVIATAFVGTYFYYGWESAIVLIGMFVVASVVSRILAPKPESSMYLHIIDRAVARRARELERDGDRALTAFANGTADKMRTLYPDRLPSAPRST